MDFIQDQPMVKAIIGGGFIVLILTLLSQSKDKPSPVATAEASVASSPSPPKSTAAVSKKKKKKKSVKKDEPTVLPEPVPEPVEAAAPAKKKKKKKKAKPTAAAAVDDAASASAPTKAPEEKKEESSPPVVVVEDEAFQVVESTKPKRKRKKKKKAAAAASTVVKETVVPAPVDDVKSDDDDDDDDDALLAFAKGLSNRSKTADEWHTKTSKKSKKKLIPVPVTPIVAEQAAENKEPAKISLNLTSKDIPVLIGPKGSTIQHLQTITGAKLDIDKGTTELRISGSEEAIAHAMEEVQSLLSAEANKTAYSVTLSGSSIKGSDGIKAIIGRGGATIKNIQATTGCQLNASIDAGSVSISGPSQDAVDRAATLCKNAVFGESNTIVDLKSRSMVNMICGPSFKNLQKLQNETGARLDVSRGETTLKISGDTNNVLNAKNLVQQLITEYEGVTMELEASKIGAVFGKGGKNLRAIQERTGVQIEIEDGEGMSICRIIGAAAAVSQAQIMIQKSLSGEVELKPGEVQVSVELGVGTPAVIGRGGSKIKELEKTHGVKLNVQNASNVCSIVGKKDAVEGAKTAIEAIVKPLIEKAIEEAEIQEQSEMMAVSGENGWGAAEETGW